MRYDKNLYSKEKNEKLIMESPLFELDMVEQKSEYETECKRMIQYLYCYLLGINYEKYRNYSCEIIKVANDCIKGFRKGRGVFLHYFNVSWKKKYMEIKGKEAVDQRMRGMMISSNDIKDIGNYVRLVNKLRPDVSKKDIYERVSAAMGIPVDKVRQIAELAEVRVLYEDCTDGEDEWSIWENISDGKLVSNNIEEVEMSREVFDTVELVYRKIQVRQKPIISDIMTVRVRNYLSEELMEQYGFINKEIADNWLKNGNVPTQKEIAQKYSRDETSLSRTVNEFLKKLKTAYFDI